MNSVNCQLVLSEAVKLIPLGGIEGVCNFECCFSVQRFQHELTEKDLPQVAAGVS